VKEASGAAQKQRIRTAQSQCIDTERSTASFQGVQAFKQIHKIPYSPACVAGLGRQMGPRHIAARMQPRLDTTLMRSCLPRGASNVQSLCTATAPAVPNRLNRILWRFQTCGRGAGISKMCADACSFRRTGTLERRWQLRSRQGVAHRRTGTDLAEPTHAAADSAGASPSQVRGSVAACFWRPIRWDGGDWRVCKCTDWSAAVHSRVCN
jgi:hypothetical protein